MTVGHPLAQVHGLVGGPRIPDTTLTMEWGTPHYGWYGSYVAMAPSNEEYENTQGIY